MRAIISSFIPPSWQHVIANNYTISLTLHMALVRVNYKQERSSYSSNPSNIKQKYRVPIGPNKSIVGTRYFYPKKVSRYCIGGTYRVPTILRYIPSNALLTSHIVICQCVCRILFPLYYASSGQSSLRQGKILCGDFKSVSFMHAESI